MNNNPGKDRAHNNSRANRPPVAASVAALRAGNRADRTWIGAGVAILAFAAVAALSITDRNNHHEAAQNAIPATPISSAIGSDSPPPWPAPSDVSAAVRQAGLPMLRSEGSALHIHAHLDVFVEGRRVPVPASIGIDSRADTISPLHTHNGSGVMHIESPVAANFSLAQFFTEWQVALSATQLGGLRADNAHQLRAYVNGWQTFGDPGALILHSHDQIALVYGRAPDPVPSTYEWGSL